jgi:hypothetical protein
MNIPIQLVIDLSIIDGKVLLMASPLCYIKKNSESFKRFREAICAIGLSFHPLERYLLKRLWPFRPIAAILYHNCKKCLSKQKTDDIIQTMFSGRHEQTVTPQHFTTKIYKRIHGSLLLSPKLGVLAYSVAAHQ